MSEDLEKILQSVANTLKQQNDRIAALEARGQDQGQDWGAPSEMGWVSPTSPPGLSVQISRGIAFRNDEYNPSSDWVYPEYMLTFGWPDYVFDMTPYVSAFSDAYYYRLVVITKPMSTVNYAGWDLYEYPWGDFETYQECVEDAWDAIQSGIIDLYDGNPYWPDAIISFAALILRNNGTIGSAGQYLPVTLHDTEQSTIFIRDFRPWFWAAQ